MVMACPMCRVECSAACTSRPEHGGRQPSAADLAGVEQPGGSMARSWARLRSMTAFRPMTSVERPTGGSPGASSPARNSSCGALERLAAGVGQEPVERAAGVADVEADRRRAARPRPQLRRA